jgi:hypothetical protein
VVQQDLVVVQDIFYYLLQLNCRMFALRIIDSQSAGSRQLCSKTDVLHTQAKVVNPDPRGTGKFEEHELFVQFRASFLSR